MNKFKIFGKIFAVEIKRDVFGSSKEIALIYFEDRNKAKIALQMNDKVIDSKKLSV